MSSFALAALVVTTTTGYSLGGRVLDAATGAPIPSVIVRAGADTATTTSGGQYLLTNLSREVQVHLHRADYEDGRYAFTIAADLQRDFALEPRVVDSLADLVVEAPAPTRDDTHAAQILDGDALALARSKGLADALAELSGVSVLRSGSSAKPIVRGQSGPRVLILLDGVRHESQDWGLDHGPEIDPYAAGAMTVVKGAAGVRYGPDAVAGVLLVDPPPMLETLGQRAEIEAALQSNGRRGTLAGRVDASLIPGLALRLEGNITRAAALVAPDYPLDNTGLFAFNLGAAAEYARGDSSLKLAYRHHDLSAGICTCLDNGSHADLLAQILRERPRGYEEYKRDYAIERPSQSVQHDLVLARGRTGTWIGELTVTYAFQQNLRREYDIVRSSVEGPQFDFTLRTHTFDAALVNAPIALGDLDLIGTAGGTLIAQENLYRGLPLIPNYRMMGFGAYALARLVGHAWEIEAGARLDLSSRRVFLDRSADARRRARGGEPCPLVDGVARCDHTYPSATFSLGALTRLSEGLSAKVDLSSASRAPSIDEQYIDGTAPTSPIVAVGDPSLGIETTYSTSATLVAEYPNLRAELSVFGSYVDDYIQLAPALGAGGVPVIDVLIRGAFPRYTHRAIDAVLCGADADVKVSLSVFELSARGALVRGWDLDRSAYLALVPADRLDVGLTYRAPSFGPFESGFATLRAELVRRQSRTDAGTDLAPGPPGYVRLGADLGTEFTAWDRRFHASVGLDNALDRTYRDYTSLQRYFADEPGRSFTLRLRAEL